MSLMLFRTMHSGDVSLDAATSRDNSHSSGLHVSSKSSCFIFVSELCGSFGVGSCVACYQQPKLFCCLVSSLGLSVCNYSAG